MLIIDRWCSVLGVWVKWAKLKKLLLRQSVLGIVTRPRHYETGKHPSYCISELLGYCPSLLGGYVPWVDG